MSNKKLYSTDDSLAHQNLSRPQGSIKPEIISDPSDSNLPNRRNKQNQLYFLSKHVRINDLLLIDTSPYVKKPTKRRPSSSNVKQCAPKIVRINKMDLCYLCSTNSPKLKMINCPVCYTKTHVDCLIVNEPLWKFKLDSCQWICDECRKNICSICLKYKTRLKLLHSCNTCNVGLHKHCYESYDIKPLHLLESNKFICTPCMTFANQQKVKVEEDNDLVNTHTTNAFLFGMPKEENQDLKSNTLDNSSIKSTNGEANSSATSKNVIPDVTKWNKFQVYEYLSKLLPAIISNKILEYDIDGCALQLLTRKDIVMNMNLTLGYALNLYKEIRILQTQSTFPAVYWE